MSPTNPPLVLVDQALPVAAAALRGPAELRPFVGRALGPATEGLASAAALVVRSTARIGESILAAAPHLRVVASATIGLDHVDLVAAARRGVRVTRVPGCNAPGVADWVVAAIVLDALRHGRGLLGRTLAVVGAGQTGSRVLTRAAALGFAVRACDPPRAEREGGFRGVPLRAALTADVVSLHLPRTARGTTPWPTAGLLDAGALAQLGSRSLLLNAARGDLVDEAALRAALADRRRGPRAAALDTFRGEPRPDPATVAAAFLATPHVAGATHEGRFRAQVGAAQAVAAALGLAPQPVPAPLPSAATRTVDVTGCAADPEAEALTAAAALLDAALPLAATDVGLRACAERGESFDELRDAHDRHELGALRLALEGCPTERTVAVADALGFARVRPGEAPHLVLRVG
jgi:erythronate-4-phosphate dehydrogenase